MDRALFILAEAATALRRNLGMTFAAVSTVALSLFVLGGLALSYLAVADYAGGLPGRFEMRAYMRDDATPAEVSLAARRIRALPGVASAAWIPRAASWRRFSEENPALVEGLENPFPEGFRIVLNDLARADAVARRVAEIPEMDPAGVRYPKDEGRLAESALRVLRWLGATVGALLALTAGILVFNAIRLALLSRRVEIRVMRLVGAPSYVVLSPFLIEGLVQGAVGGLLAALMLRSAHIVLAGFVRSLSNLSTLPAFPNAAMPALAALGGAYGLLCSALALFRLPLRTR